MQEDFCISAARRISLKLSSRRCAALSVKFLVLWTLGGGGVGSLGPSRSPNLTSHGLSCKVMLKLSYIDACNSADAWLKWSEATDWSLRLLDQWRQRCRGLYDLQLHICRFTKGQNVDIWAHFGSNFLLICIMVKKLLLLLLWKSKAVPVTGRGGL
jgi:hypothetical protein